MKQRGLLACTALVVCLGLGLDGVATAADLPVKAGRPAVAAGIPIGGWMFSPTLFAGAVYNSNVNQTTNNAVSSWGARVIPGFTANLDNGIWQTSLYGVADLRSYTGSGVDHKTTVDAKAGLTETWLVTRDTTIHANVDYTRQADVFGSSAFQQTGPISPTSTAPVAPITVSPQVSPNRYNQYSGAVGFDRRFGHFFVGSGVNAVYTQFDSNPGVTTSRDGGVYTLTSRVGFDITPQVYTFVDPSYNWQRQRDSRRDAQGYRVTAGLGTAGNGLWQGEVFGGYQSEKNDFAGTYNSAVYGVRVGYSPTPMWALQASLDESLGASTVPTIGTVGLATKVTTALASATYKGLPQGWGASGRFGFVHTAFVNDPREDDAWLAGANVTYEIWRNLGLTLDYQYTTNRSNAEAQSFNTHLVSVGATYKY